MNLRTELVTLAKYGAVGLGNTLLTAALMALLSLTGLAYPAYTALAYLAGMVQSYLLNRRFTFHRTGQPLSPASPGQVLRFLGVSLLCLGLAQLVQALAREIVLLPLWLSLGIGMAGYTALGFGLNRLWVFHSPPAGTQAGTPAGGAAGPDHTPTPPKGNTP